MAGISLLLVNRWTSQRCGFFGVPGQVISHALGLDGIFGNAFREIPFPEITPRHQTAGLGGGFRQRRRFRRSILVSRAGGGLPCPPSTPPLLSSLRQAPGQTPRLPQASEGTGLRQGQAVEARPGPTCGGRLLAAMPGPPAPSPASPCPGSPHPTVPRSPLSPGAPPALSSPHLGPRGSRWLLLCDFIYLFI